MHRNKLRESGKMRRQKNTFQTKEQNKASVKDLNEMEISNPPNRVQSNGHKDVNQIQKNG